MSSYPFFFALHRICEFCIKLKIFVKKTSISSKPELFFFFSQGCMVIAAPISSISLFPRNRAMVFSYTHLFQWHTYASPSILPGSIFKKKYSTRLRCGAVPVSKQKQEQGVKNASKTALKCPLSAGCKAQKAESANQASTMLNKMAIRHGLD